MARVIVAAALAAAALSSPAASASDTPSVPPGFAVTHYGAVGGAATSLSWGVDTRDPDRPPRLYVADYLNGQIVVFDDVAGAGAGPDVFAEGFSSPLGVLGAPDGSVYVADSTTRKGPFGSRPYGRVWRLRDLDGDGVAEKRTLVIGDLPNGRHNTNGMAIGPDGKLYVTNGNSTDDGVEGGQPEVRPWSGSLLRLDPRGKRLSLKSLPVRRTLVATGMRNVYDVAFSPVDPTLAWLPTNGVDDARPQEKEGEGEEGRENSDDLLYVSDINDRSGGRPYAEHFGFPQCLYNIEKTETLVPYNNPNPRVRKMFGRCVLSKIERPKATFGLHVSANGAAFQTTDAWGPEYQDDLFVAEFGNLYGDEVRGHDVVRVAFDATGRKVTEQSVFTVGGTPLDVTFDTAGNLYLLDFAGDVFRISQI